VNRYRLTCLLAVLAFSFLCFYFVVEVQAQARKIRISGGSVLSDPINECVKGFREKSKTCDVDVFVMTSGQGISKLLEGEAELAMAARDMTAEEKAKAAEKGLAVTGRLLVTFGIAVIANPMCPVNELTLEEIRDIFTGSTTNWKAFGGQNESITVLTRSVPDTGSGVVFQDLVLKGAQYASGHIVVKSFREMVTACRSTNAIGYVPTSSIYYSHRDYFKEIKVKKTVDSPALDAKQADFPIPLPFYLFWNPKAADRCTSEFLDFCSGVMKK